MGMLILCLLALGVGIFTGIGAVALRSLIGLIHNLMFNGVFKIAYDANILEGPSRWGNWVILSPILGGLLVVYMVERFAPEAKGHGVPEVMDAIFYKRGNIRGIVAVIKSLASALSIGSGASVGREGPIIQIGAALGSSFSQAIGLSAGQKITLLSAGAGAGIAATFNTPLGGVLFAIEILLPEVSNRTFLPVVIATGASTLVGRILIGPNPAFAVPEVFFPSASAFGVEEAIAFTLLGALCGVAAWAFIRLLVFMEDGFPKLPGNIYTQNIVGMALVGLMMVGFTHAFGHSYVDGVGYGVIQSILDKGMTATSLLVLLFALKLLATTISLGCGASGGIFSPSLYLGATLGAAFASLATLVLPNAGLTLPSAAIVGMAAMVGAGTGGVMTAIVMMFEMTRDYAIIVPVIVAVAVAAGVRRALIPRRSTPSSCATAAIASRRSGTSIFISSSRRRTSWRRRFILAKAGSTLRECMGWEDVDDLRAIDRRARGQDRRLDPAALRPLARKREQSRTGWWTISSRSALVVCRDVDLLSLVLARLKRHRAGAAIVFNGEHRPRAGDVVGVITKRAIADAVIDNYTD